MLTKLKMSIKVSINQLKHTVKRAGFFWDIKAYVNIGTSTDNVALRTLSAPAKLDILLVALHRETVRFEEGIV